MLPNLAPLFPDDNTCKEYKSDLNRTWRLRMNVLQSPPVQNDTVTLVTHGDNRRNETLLTLLSYWTGITSPFRVIVRGIQEH